MKTCTSDLQNLDLKNRRVLVTGGTRGIGKAIAQKLSSSGAHVTITGTKPSNELPREFDFIEVDFKDLHETNLAAEAIKKLKPDILVNNAGITAVGDFTALGLEAYTNVESVNLRAPFILTQAALPSMIENKWGRIVNISSIFGVIGRDRRAPYCITKFGLNGMTTALSAEVAQHGVLVNSVCPGFINTELTASVLSPREIEDLVSRVPAKRLGKPEEVAELVLWLASPKNTFVSGQSIVIDGGYTGV